jgi:uncharacterized protein YndB with AHSA1/START domain
MELHMEPDDHTDATVHREIELDVDLGEMWQLVSSADELATWLADRVDLDVRPGACGVIVDDGVAHRVEVDEVIDGERVSWRWWRDDEDGSCGSRVELVIAPGPTGSRLVVTETRLAPAVASAVRTPGRTSLRTSRWELRAAMLHLVAVAAFVAA